jgi:hypothetical protein
MKDCAYYHEVEPGVLGECHRITPTMDTANGRLTSWPRVNPEDEVCSAFLCRSCETSETISMTIGGESREVAPPLSDRHALILGNDSGVVVYLKYSPGASATSWTHRLAPNSEIVILGSLWNGAVHAAREVGSRSQLFVTTILK